MNNYTLDEFVIFVDGSLFCTCHSIGEAMKFVDENFADCDVNDFCIYHMVYRSCKGPNAGMFYPQ